MGLSYVPQLHENSSEHDLTKRTRDFSQIVLEDCFMGGRQTKRQRRSEGVGHQREVWSDHDFGLSLKMNNYGRALVTWRPDREVSIALLGLERVRGLLSELEREWVLQLRESGASWDDVGMFLAITGEAARRRHGAADREVADAAGGEDQ
jgi:hypothetical protein